MRRTSIEAFQEITSSGLLSKTRMAVYRDLFYQGPLTANQLASVMGVRVKGSVCARLTELRDQGVVYEVSEVRCPISKRKTILWDVTERLPTKLEKELKKRCECCGQIIKK